MHYATPPLRGESCWSYQMLSAKMPGAVSDPVLVAERLGMQE